MTTADERMKILKMISEGKITAEDGTKLLQALSKINEKPARGASPTQEGGQARYMRVRVTDTTAGKVKVNVSLPIGLLDVGMRMGARFIPDMEDLEYDDIMASIQEGLRGKVIDVEDADTGEKVEVFLE